MTVAMMMTSPRKKKVDPQDPPPPPTAVISAGFGFGNTECYRLDLEYSHAKVFLVRRAMSSKAERLSRSGHLVGMDRIGAYIMRFSERVSAESGKCQMLGLVGPRVGAAERGACGGEIRRSSSGPLQEMSVRE